MTLADKIVALKSYPDVEIKRAADMLKKPARNHVAQAFDPLVERFVFDAEVDQQLKSVFCGDRAKDLRRIAVASARIPIMPCWLEIGGTTGWLFYEIFNVGYVALFNETNIGPVCLGRAPSALYGCSDFLSDDYVFNLEISPVAGRFNVSHKDVGNDLIKAAYLLAVYSQPHMSTTERVTYGKLQGSAAARAMARRKAQKHGGVYSFNVVKLKVPKPSEIHGFVAATGSCAPKRGHMRIGHWRLIDGKIEPYWTWVEACEVGDRSLGWVTKQREISISSGLSRRGFELPSFCGRPGERIPARPTREGHPS
jgi:hypothetical protein